MSQIKPIYHADYFALSASTPMRVLSSAALNGGLTEMRSFLNMRVDLNAPPPFPPAADTIALKASELQLAQPVCGMMTAASMKSLCHAHLYQDTLEVQCWVTAGLSNLLRAGDPNGAAPRAGTINILLWINQPLTDAAMAEALILLTEAKVTAIRDLQLVSPLSGLPASGTGTDSHAVFCPPGASEPYCGKHTSIGELIGKAVLNACQQSLKRCIEAAQTSD